MAATSKMTETMDNVSETDITKSRQNSGHQNGNFLELPF